MVVVERQKLDSGKALARNRWIVYLYLSLPAKGKREQGGTALKIPLFLSFLLFRCSVFYAFAPASPATPSFSSGLPAGTDSCLAATESLLFSTVRREPRRVNHSTTAEPRDAASSVQVAILLSESRDRG